MSKICPICKDGTVRLETDWDNKADGYHRIYARCSACGARTASFPSMIEAKSAWEEEQVTDGDLYQTNIFELMEAKNG